MAKRIGELLLEKGLITQRQLARALHTQLVTGGHLGTCLVELGFAEIDEVGRALAEVQHLRYARREMFVGLPEWIVRSISPEFAEQFEVVPIGKEDRSLHLAVISPSRLSTLSSRTGYRIVPWIAPEIRIREALEQYYDIPRRPRYLALSQFTSQGGLLAARRSDAGRRAVPGLSSTEQAAIHATPRKPSPPPAPTPSPLRSEPRVNENVAGATALAVAAPVETRPTRIPIDSFTEAVRRLSLADDREELASVVVSYVSRHVPRCMLFGVKEMSAYVWDWQGIGLEPANVFDLQIPVIGGSIFELLLGDEMFWGPIPPQADVRAFYDALGSPAPAEVLLLPIHLNDRLVAVLYAEGDSASPIEGDAETYRQLVAKISMALNMIILKMKIRAV